MLISAGRTSITPAHPVALAGYGGRFSPFKQVADPLEINTAVLRCDGQVVILISADLLYVTDDLRDAAIKHCADKHSIDISSILLAATHTHFAPSVDPSKPNLGPVDEDYARFVTDQLTGLLDRLLADPGIAVSLCYAQLPVPLAINRRRMAWGLTGNRIEKQMRLLPNLRGPRDEMARVIVFRDDQNHIVASIWNWACHPTGFPFRDRVSADFPGVVRGRLRHEHGGGELPVLFFQGFAGDVRPTALDKAWSLRSILRRMFYGQCFGQFTPEDYRSWANRIADEVLSAIKSALSHPPLTPRLDCSTVSVAAATLFEASSTRQLLRLRRIAIAGDLVLLSLSAEVVTEYLAHVRAALPGLRVIPVSCADSVYGYLPTSQMLAEGGYEVQGFLHLFNLCGRYKTSVEQSVVDLMAAVAERRPGETTLGAAPTHSGSALSSERQGR